MASHSGLKARKVRMLDIDTKRIRSCVFERNFGRRCHRNRNCSERD